MTDPVARYLELLGEFDAIEVLQATPARLLQLFESYTHADLEAPYEPGKWSRRELIAHLADVEVVMGFRFRQLAAVPGVELQPIDQDVWSRRYQQLEPSLAVEAFRAQRAWNLALFATFSLEDWLAEAFHPERGFESNDLMVRMLAGHDLNHLTQLELA
ncbi:MAG TPA: DinB family protein [Trueperaceae bacterium]|nr:DinB family protein [Trueperaceae bacterium]